MKDRSNKNNKKAKTVQSRAVRFPIRTEIRFRPKGKMDWRTGETRNISRSGVLFNASDLLAVNTALDLTFPLPTEIGSEAGAIVLCRGHIVRTILPPASDLPGAMAANFSDYQLKKKNPAAEPEKSK
jgi:PilZ domain-containing protein